MKPQDLAAVFEAVKVIPLRETDVLVLTTPRAISKAQEEMVVEVVREITGHHLVLVLAGGMDAQVMRPERAAPWWKFWRS